MTLTPWTWPRYTVIVASYWVVLVFGWIVYKMSSAPLSQCGAPTKDPTTGVVAQTVWFEISLAPIALLLIGPPLVLLLVWWTRRRRQPSAAA